MSETFPVAGAEIIPAGHSSGIRHEAMFRAAALTGCRYSAAAAGSVQAVFLAGADPQRRGRLNHAGKRSVADIAQPVLRIDIMIACIDIAIVNRGQTTFFTVIFP